MEITFGPEHGLDPVVPNLDSDKDRLPDPYEILVGTDPNNPDTDGDGVVDVYEDHYSDPLNPDTDGDGMDDGYEMRMRECGIPVSLTYADPDSDHDKVPDLVEVILNYNLLDPDSNHDGISDYDEFQETLKISICKK